MKRMYNYEKYFNGGEHRIKRDRDFCVSPKTMQVLLHKAAKRMGVRITTRTWNGDVFVQAVS